MTGWPPLCQQLDEGRAREKIEEQRGSVTNATINAHNMLLETLVDAGRYGVDGDEHKENLLKPLGALIDSMHGSPKNKNDETGGRDTDRASQEEEATEV